MTDEQKKRLQEQFEKFMQEDPPEQSTEFDQAFDEAVKKLDTEHKIKEVDALTARTPTEYKDKRDLLSVLKTELDALTETTNANIINDNESLNITDKAEVKPPQENDVPESNSSVLVTWPEIEGYIGHARHTIKDTYAPMCNVSIGKNPKGQVTMLIEDAQTIKKRFRSKSQRSRKRK